MTIDIRSLHPDFGARIDGLDLRAPLEPEVLEKVLDAFNRRQLLYFPGQDLTEMQMLAFARQFGEPEIFVDPTALNGGVPQVMHLTNLDSAGNPMGPGPRMAWMSLAEYWHNDSSYRRVPALATMLNGIIIPTSTGDTDFASLHVAYDALSDELKHKLEPLSAVHGWEYQRMLTPGREPISEEERATAPPILHRLVQSHPATARKLLYLSSSACAVEGVAEAEGRELLGRLTRVATRPEVVYTHKWRQHDLLMWDNRATLHRAAGFDYQSLTLRRKMHRIVIGGVGAAQ